MILLSWIFVAASILLTIKTWNKHSKNHLTLIESLFWTTLWAAIAVLSLLPGLTSSLSTILGVGRAVDLLIYTAILALFYLVFRLYAKIEALQQDITSIVREQAIRDADD